MPIYTKTGDKGSTELVNTRLSKADAVFEFLGGTDHLQVSLRECFHSLKEILKEEHVWILDDLLLFQKVLMDINSFLSTTTLEPIEMGIVHYVEKQIDEMNCDLPPLTNFIIFGTTKIQCKIHSSRIIARQVERDYVRQTFKKHEVIGKFLNRLSDYLFILARYVDELQHNTEEIYYYSSQRIH